MRIIGSLSAPRSFLRNAALLLLTAAIAVSAQSQAGKNNPYAPSPAGNAPQVSSQLPGNVPKRQIASIPNERPNAEARTQKVNFEVPTPSVVTPIPIAIPPTDIYRIGTGDVLHIRLGNAVAGTAYYAVHQDGSIDFPLAGDEVNVKGLTVADVTKKLRSSIKLFSNPKIEVALAEYASHVVTVLGKVQNPGEKNLRREAVPLFVIKAEALVEAEAKVVKITAFDGAPQTYALHDAQTDSILIYPGTTLEFGVEDLRPFARYFVAGSAMKTTERVLPSGLTLSKVAASESADAKRASIHRKDKGGKFMSRDFDLTAIRAGKAADPAIESGDVIQIRH